MVLLELLPCEYDCTRLMWLEVLEGRANSGKITGFETFFDLETNEILVENQ